MKFRKKPIVIEAIKWTGKNWDDVSNFHRGDHFSITTMSDGTYLNILTLEGVMQARPGDWIIKGVKGEVYPCKPDIFEATYEEVELPDKDLND